jgi:hypothetical protein
MCSKLYNVLKDIHCVQSYYNVYSIFKVIQCVQSYYDVVARQR